jgi:hypothetical protein
MAELAIITTIASVAAAGVSAAGTIAAGNAAKDQGKTEQAVANWEAAQADIKAKDERASGQRDALQLRRQKNLALSSLQANAAASGFTATDPTSLALADEISSYGTTQEQMAMYGGESRAQGLTMAAAGRRAGGRMAADLGRAKQTASYFNAGSTILGGISSMGDKYAKRQPASETGRYGSSR